MSDVDTLDAKAKLTSRGMQEDKLGGFKVQGRFRRLEHVLDDDTYILSSRDMLYIAMRIAKALDFMDNNGFRCTEFGPEDVYLKDLGGEVCM